MTAATALSLPTWSIQQQDFLRWAKTGKGSCVLEAVAGAGKTTVLIEAAKQMVGTVAVMAFNKRIGEEIKTKLKRQGVDSRKANAGTVHSFGFKAYMKHQPQAKVSDRKLRNIFFALFPEKTREFPFKDSILKLASMAKQRAIGIDGFAKVDDAQAWLDIIGTYDIIAESEDGHSAPVDVIIAAARAVLAKSVEDIDTIDFDDMIYMPLALKLRMFQYDVVIIDEAQDTNPARRALARAMLKKTGRLIAVGDPCQPLGTQVSVPVKTNRWSADAPKTVAIEDIKEGDMVVSYHTYDTAFLPNGRRVNGITRRPYSGDLIAVRTADGRLSRYAPAHFCYASFTDLRDKFAVYIMRKGNQYRIGKTRMSASAASGLPARMSQEGADAAWLLNAYNTEHEAFLWEQSISARFGIPQLTFKTSNNSRDKMDDILFFAWNYIGDNSRQADAALTTFGRDIRYPLFERGTGKHQTIKRPIVVRACNLIDGVKVLPYNRKINDSHAHRSDWLPISVAREFYDGDVVSLDVAETHLYVADGIVTRNCQAINGFTGADNDSLDIIRREFNAIGLPLTITYRCPKAVVNFAHQWVSHIQAADTAPEGSVSSMELVDMVALPIRVLNRDAAVLCRNTKPLIELFFKLLRRRIPARVEGRDLANGLKKLATRWTSVKTITTLEERLTSYLEEEKEDERNKDRETWLQTLEDMVESILTICEQCRLERKDRVDDVLEYLDGMFADDVDNMLVLSTIHKSKGREWKRIYWLDRYGTCPSPWAKQEWQMTQEINLMYVAATRAQEELIDVTVPPKKGS